jgi:two-component system, OmpR family, sensor kinase
VASSKARSRSGRRGLPGGLRARLTSLVAAAIILSVAVIFYVVYTDTGTELRRQIDHDLAGDTTQLSQAVMAHAGQDAGQIAVRAHAYVRAQPYDATSTLLFIFVPGARPAFNHPEIVGSAQPDEDETPAQQATEDADARLLLVPHLGYTVRQVPDVGATRVLERAVSVGGLHVVVGAGEPLAVVHRAQDGVARTFVLAGALTLALALLASYLTGARLSAPLRRMAGVAARVDAGELEPRMEVPSGDGEVTVLAEAFNNMLDRLTGELKGQRQFIADASHELRTPITVIRGQLEVLAAQTDPSATDVRRTEEHVQREITRMSRLIDDLLLLAQAEHPDFVRPERIDLRTFVDQLWDGVSLTADRQFELGAVPSGVLRADPDRLAQALHNLVRNAIAQTSEHSGVVSLAVDQPQPGQIRFVVTDNGPGIPAAERERVFERFHRTDPARSRSRGGAGLGLAIVRAIAEAHHGAVRAGQPAPDAAGARIELVLPGFEPSVSARPAQRTPVP